MRRMMGKRQYLIGLAVLLLSPLLVLAALYAYVAAANAMPQEGRLRAAVEPQAVLPWGEAAYAVTYAGGKPEEAPAAEPPVDIAFLIDVSGSMTESLPDMSRAAHRVARELAGGKPGLVRFALIRFDTEAEVTTDWTEDPERLFEGLKRLRAFTGQNDTRAAFTKLDELLGRARDDAKRAVVFYTDGYLEACPPCGGVFPAGTGCCPGGPMRESEIVGAAKRLREGGVDIYSIGLPSMPTSPLMAAVCDSPARVYAPSSAADLAENFRSVAQGITGAPAGGAQVTHRLDGRHFSAPLEGTSWTVAGGGALSLGIGPLPESPATYRHPLVPLSSGVWRVGVEPARLTYADDRGRAQSVSAGRRPLLLVVGWLPLLWGLLPALLWTLYYFGQRAPAVADLDPALPAPQRQHPPTLLPVIRGAREEREAPVPTLFVGLGGAGRRALHAVRAELKQSHLAREGLPYRFLWLDLDSKEAARAPFFEDWPQYPVEPLPAPPEVYRTDGYMPEIGRSPEHLKWFEAQRYHNAPREDLNLAEGAKGDRLLARLALFRWIGERGGPSAKLVEACEELAALDSVDGTRQVVVFAGPDGGVGGGWFVDIGRLLRRITRRQQRQGGAAFAPDLIGVLCDSPERPRPENRRAVEMEIESSLLSGAFPQHVTYGPGGDGLLDATDTESPYNWVFSAGGADAQGVAAQCGELGAVFVERRPRSALLDEADALGMPLVRTRVNAVHVLRTQLYEQVRHELFLRLVGPDILLDIGPSARGGFAPVRVADEAAAEGLAEWARAEPPGTPLQLLLASAADAALTPGFLKSMRSPTAPGPEWFANVLSASVTRRLRGEAHHGAEWSRGWMPSRAVAVLRLLARGLSDSTRPRARELGATESTLEVIDGVAGFAGSLADELERWVAEFCAVCEEVSRRRQEYSRVGEGLRGLGGRTYIDPPGERGRVEALTKEIFENWLGTPDTVSAIRERLFFSAAPDGARARVSVRSYIGEPKEFHDAAEAGATLEGYMSALATAVPAVRIGGALAAEPAERREAMARGLVEVASAPRRVLVLTPRPVERQGGEARTLEEFRALIPQPASHGERGEASGDDHSAVRRVELKEVTAEDVQHHEGVPFVAAAEQAGERVRKRAQKKHGLFVPPFPPELRIALAHTDSFLSFVRDYKAGRIVRQEDAAGAPQWALSGTSDFLTFGGDSSLAHAAANYVWYAKSPPPGAAPPAAAGGDFARLRNWLQKRNHPDEETLVQVAIDAYED